MGDDQIITLTGDNFTSYQAGVHYGSAAALRDCAEHATKLERHFKHQLRLMSAAMLEALPPDHTLRVSVLDLPNMSGALSLMANQLQDKSRQHSSQGTKMVSRLNVSLTLRKVFHRRGWPTVALALVMMVALVYALTLSK